MPEPLQWMSVKYKLPMMFGAVCLLAFGVGGAFVSRSARVVLETEILERLSFQGQAYATALDSRLQALIQRAEDFASDGYIRAHLHDLESARSTEDGASLRRELERHLTINKLPLVPAFRALTVLDGQGRIVVQGLPDRELVERVAALAKTSCTWTSGVLSSEGEARPSLAVATPLHDLAANEIIGNLLVWIQPASWLLGALPAASTGSETSAEENEVVLTLFDRDGRGFVVPRTFLAPGAPAESSEIARLGTGLSVVEPGGDAEQDSYSPIRATFSRGFPIAANGWTVRVKLKSLRALDTIAGFQSRLLAVGIVLATLAALLLFFPMRYLVHPLLQLTQAARRIKQGDFGIRVPVDSGDEIGELSRAFNAMAEGLAERTDRLKENALHLREKEEEVRHKRDRLDAVIASMRDGLVVLDAEGKIELSNQAARPFLDLLDRHDIQLTSHHVCGTRGETTGDCSACLVDPGGLPRSCVIDVGTRVFEVHATPLRREAGRSGRVLVARDVSDRIAQDERQIHQERLAVLGEVAAVMAHEVNNPLTSINMFNQMLGDELPADSPSQECVAVIRRNVETCKQTLRKLLDYATGATPEIEIVDVHEILRDVMRFLHPVSKRTPVEVTWALRAEHHLVRGDEVQLRQVFVNLAMNAFQAMNGGGKQVSIHTHSDDTHLLVDVVDEGEGIAEETRDEIFRPFFTSKPRGSGTGLGLPTARRITEMHGGSLDLLESRPGRTVFQVRLRHDGSAVPFRDPLSAATLVPATDGGGAPRCP